MDKPTGFNLVLQQALQTLITQPVVFAPMLIYSVALAIVEQYLPKTVTGAAQPALLLMFASAVVSLWFQMCSLTMMWQTSLSGDIDPLQSLRKASITYVRSLLILGSVACLVVLLGYAWVSQMPAFPYKTYVEYGLAGLLTMSFVYGSQMLPVALMVEPLSTAQCLLILVRLLQLRLGPILRYMLLMSLLFVSALAVSVVFFDVPFIPPLLQGVVTTYMLCISYFFYINVTRVDVVS